MKPPFIDVDKFVWSHNKDRRVVAVTNESAAVLSWIIQDLQYQRIAGRGGLTLIFSSIQFDHWWARLVEAPEQGQHRTENIRLGLQAVGDTQDIFDTPANIPVCRRVVPCKAGQT
jgi:hypothetical protein